VATELATWRKQFTIDDAKAQCRQSREDKYSVAILASGGLLDTLAAIRAGMIPIWGSETCTIKQKIWMDLVGNECHGDAFRLDYSTLRRPRVLKTGFPCLDYSGLGHQQGSKGSTGWMYVKQAEIILKISPDVAIIEQTDGVMRVDDGSAVDLLVDQLSN
jgi:site-specific DNA-cytosine methylase